MTILYLDLEKKKLFRFPVVIRYENDDKKTFTEGCPARNRLI